MNRQPKPPTGCVDVDEHERELTAWAARLADEATKLLDNGGPIFVSRGRELAEVARKYRSEAAQLAAQRAAREHEEWLLAEARKLDGVGLGAMRERAPLKRKP